MIECTVYDLEHEIFNAWQICGDLRMVSGSVGTMSQEDIATILDSLANITDLRFSKVSDMLNRIHRLNEHYKEDEEQIIKPKKGSKKCQK